MQEPESRRPHSVGKHKSKIIYMFNPSYLLFPGIFSLVSAQVCNR